MRKIIVHLIVFISCFAVPNYFALAASSPPLAGAVLPDIKLVAPQNPGERDYLGISVAGSFKIPQIKTSIVIIEIFSMYCPFCQAKAPKINELYYAIEKNLNLKGRIKLIGIGAGNSSFEVGVFRKTYDIPFPLFPDGDFSIHKALGEVRTPYFIGVKINDNGNRVFYSKPGGFEKPEQFLGLMLKLSGLKGED